MKPKKYKEHHLIQYIYTFFFKLQLDDKFPLFFNWKLFKKIHQDKHPSRGENYFVAQVKAFSMRTQVRAETPTAMTREC